MRKAPPLFDVEKRVIQNFEDAVYKRAQTPNSCEEWEDITREYYEAKLALMEMIYELRS